MADQANAIGGIDAVIHNAAVYVDPRRVATPEGHARTLAVNVLAPYLLTAWINRPSRLVYMSSGMHNDGDASLRDIDWTARRWNGVQAYCDSKLFITALTLAVARRWPDAPAPTRWTRVGADQNGRPRSAGRPRAGLSHPDVAGRQRSSRGDRSARLLVPPAPPIARPAALDESFQDALLDELIRLTHVHLPWTRATI